MINRIFILIILLLTFHFTKASVSDDCLKIMDGNNFNQISTNNYISYDSAGVMEACRDMFPSWGERFILKRQGTDNFEATYFVKRSYCLARNVFDSNSCLWSGSLSFGDDYSATFAFSDIKAAGDSSGSKTLMNGGWWGHHVCLKRYMPGDQFLHTGTNNYKRNAICGYVVLALASGECNSPFNGWNNALIGCVEEPLKSGPPTFNQVIPASITPYLDPITALNDYTNTQGQIVPGYKSLGSTFDQPLIRMLNGNTIGGSLLLRYKFPGDTRSFDDIPSSGSFPSDSNSIVYKAMVDLNNPGQVCVCSSSECDNRIYLGCVDRPTPKDSNMKVVANYSVAVNLNSDGIYPAVYPDFAYTDGSGNIIYYDADNSKVAYDSNGNATKADPNGLPTSTPANGQLHYKALPNINGGSAIGEYYAVQTQDYFAYQRDTVTSYGVAFEAMIPQIKSDGTPAFIALETPYTRAATDGCGALEIAANPLDPTKPTYFIPAGDRDRTYCNCPYGKNPNACAVPPVTKCNDGTIQNNQQDAVNVYCPGTLLSPSQVWGSNSICLQPSTSWNFVNYNYDQMCAVIPTSCSAQPNITISYGLTTWPQLNPGAQINSICNPLAGNEPIKIYQWSPAVAILQANFDCSQVSGDCSNAYTQQYLPQFSLAQQTLQTVQALANNFNRNLNQEDLNKINNSLGSFGALHTLTSASLPPQRICDTKTNTGLIKTPCVQINACSPIIVGSESSGYANWTAVPDLASNQLNQAQNQNFAEFYVPLQGACSAGYIPSNAGLPTRYCYIKYTSGQRVVESWQPVTNPCIVDPAASNPNIPNLPTS